MKPTHEEFNQAPKHDHSYCECPRCGYSQEDADDLHDEGKADTPHVWLLEYVEQTCGERSVIVWGQYECRKCHYSGVFSVMGPRTQDDLARKQRVAMIETTRGEE